MLLKDIADLINANLKGNPNIEIQGVSALKEASDGDITFFDDKKLLQILKSTKASAVIINEFISDLQIAQLKVANPRLAFASVLKIFYPVKHQFTGCSSMAFVADGCEIDSNAIIYPFAFISEKVKIGAGTVIMPFVFIGSASVIGCNCLIYPNVTIREYCAIGNNVIIHSGAVIGSDGFGYVQDLDKHVKIPQVGKVIVEDDVEIGANTTIDRATMGVTKIGKGTKIDNLVQVAHNVAIGCGSILVSQVGIAGSCEIGDYVVIGGQGAAADHTKIESGTIGAARVAFTGDVKKGVYGGAPHMPHKQFLKSAVLFSKLPEIQHKIFNLEERLKKLEAKESGGKSDD